jgi:hypothetical protein
VLEIDPSRQTLTVARFREGLASIPGAVILSIIARIVPEMKKTDNPYLGRVHKIVTATGIIGADYEQSVRRAELKTGGDGDFEAEARSWGAHVDRAFVSHGDQLYLCIQERTRTEVWYLDGKPVDPQLFAKFLPAKRDKAELVKYRNFNLRNIASITWRGQSYRLDHAA